MAIDLDILRTNLGGLEIKNPIMTASGTYGYNDEYEYFGCVSELGAIVTKAITLNPRGGNRHLRITETKAGMINSIGLENVGIERFLSEKLPVLKAKMIDFVVNIAGSTIDEYIKIAKICENNNIKAIELNVSCPNVKSGCIEFGTNEELLYELVKGVREEYKGFLIVKLTPNVTSIEKLGLVVQKAGANAVSAINTVKGTCVKLDIRGKKIGKTIVNGGYSGLGIKPIALSVVQRLYKVLDIPIIGIGGIESFEDVLEFLAVGAEAVQIGTGNFRHPDIAWEIIEELQNCIKDNGYRDLEELKKELRS